MRYTGARVTVRACDRPAVPRTRSPGLQGVAAEGESDVVVDVEDAAAHGGAVRLEDIDLIPETLDAYGFVIYAWEKTDPELRPLVDEARRAVTRLSGAGG